MKADKRRAEILSLIANSEQPVPANVLKEKFDVSRQVIVQDVAILRANGYDVIATNRGYVISSTAQARRIFKCRHTLDELIEEGNIIVDLGGKIEDIFVNHRVYGRITARLDLKTATDIKELHRSLVSGASKPLMSVTDGYHYHTVFADSEQTLDLIEQTLKDRGYLIEI